MSKENTDPAVLAIQAQIDQVDIEIQPIQAQLDELTLRRERLVTALDAVRGAIIGASPALTKEGKPRQRAKKRSIEQWRIEIRGFIYRNTPFIASDIMEEFGVSYAKANDLVREASKLGWIVPTGSKRGKFREWMRDRSRAPEPPTLTEATGEVATGGAPVSQGVRHPHKDTQKALEPALRNGATLVASGGHFKLTQPGKQPITVHSSPSDTRAVKNLRGQMRRAGYAVS